MSQCSPCELISHNLYLLVTDLRRWRFQLAKLPLQGDDFLYATLSLQAGALPSTAIPPRRRPVRVTQLRVYGNRPFKIFIFCAIIASRYIRIYGQDARNFTVGWTATVPALWERRCPAFSPARSSGVDDSAATSDAAVPLPAMQRSACDFLFSPAAIKSWHVHGRRNCRRVIRSPSKNSSARMRFVVHLQQLPDRGMRVTLRGGERRVSQ